MKKVLIIISLLLFTFACSSTYKVKPYKDKSWLRGGRDRGFITFIQRLWESYKKENQIVF